jgi:hypothetical protein
MRCFPSSPVPGALVCGQCEFFEHLIHAMVAFRQDVDLPDCRRPAQAYSLPVAKGLEVLIQQVWYAHPMALAQLNWDMIHPFCGDVQLFGHAESLAPFQMVVTI